MLLRFRLSTLTFTTNAQQHQLPTHYEIQVSFGFLRKVGRKLERNMTKNSFSWLRDRWRALSWFFGIPSDDSQSLASRSAPLTLAPPPNPRRKVPQVIEPIEDPFISSDHKKYFQYLVDSHKAFEVYDINNTFNLMIEDLFIPPHLALAPYLPVDRLPLSHLSIAQLRQDQHNIWKFVTLKHASCLAITGEPGSGKTSLLKYITLNLLNKEKRLSGEVPNKLPILLHLRHHSKMINRNSDYMLAEAIESAYLSHMLEPLPSKWFEKHLRAGQCVVMLDGLDEIADQVERKNVTRWIESQIANYSKNNFIITSRPLDYFSNPISGATVLESQPFDREQIKQFIERWYLANEINNTKSSPSSRSAKEGIEDLIQLCAKPPLSTLARNPLLLTIAATMHRSGISLSGNRVQLYGEINKFFLHSPSGRSKFDMTIAQKLQVLQPLAYHMMRHKQSEIELAEASRVIYVTLDIISRNPKGYEFLQMIADTSPLLVEQENGKYRFVHRTFQEYLAAIHMLEYRLEGQLIKHVEETWWHETIRLYGSRTDATPIIAACLRENEPSSNALIMACQCLSDRHHIQPEWQNKLASLLEGYVEHQNPVLRRVTTETLLELRLRRMMPVDNNLSIAESLITNSEYQIFIDYQRARHFKPTHWFAHSFQKGNGLKPVVGVRPSEAVAFCKWLTERDKEGRTYRLPYTNEFSPLLSKVGYWTEGKNDQVYTLENEQPVSLSLTALEQRFRSVLLSDLTCYPDEALERVRDLARALEDLLGRHDEHVGRDALILVRDFVHERAHNRALHLGQALTSSDDDTQWYTHFTSWLVTEKLVTILRQQPKPRSWLDAFDRHRSKTKLQFFDTELLTEQYFELYVDLANLEEHHQSKLLASRGIRIVASSPFKTGKQLKALKEDRPKINRQSRAASAPARRSTSAASPPSGATRTARKVVQKKICLIGDEAVGKTSLVRRYVEGRFDDKYLSTVGVSISRKTLVLPSYTMNMLVWDMEGSSNLKKTQVNYLRGAAGALIVCDLSRRETLTAFERYAHQLRALNKNVPFVLIGNKVDLDDRDVLGAELQKIAQDLKAPYLLTSAKTGTQVEEAFRILADLIEKNKK